MHSLPHLLYEICLNQNSSVFDVGNNGWVIQFKIAVGYGPKMLAD
jgi:hypothetical protein